MFQKIVAVVKKVVVCVEEDCIFCSFVCSMRGPLNVNKELVLGRNIKLNLKMKLFSMTLIN